MIIHNSVAWRGDNVTLRWIAKQFFELDKYIIKLPQEEVIDTKIMADVREALCGVIFLDSNRDYQVVEKKVINKF